MAGSSPVARYCRVVSYRSVLREWNPTSGKASPTHRGRHGCEVHLADLNPAGLRSDGSRSAFDNLGTSVVMSAGRDGRKGPFDTGPQRHAKQQAASRIVRGFKLNPEMRQVTMNANDLGYPASPADSDDSVIQGLEPPASGARPLAPFVM